MSSLTEITLQLIYKKLEEILAAIQEEKTLNQNDVFPRKEKIVSQDQFNKAMKEVMKLVNKKKSVMWKKYLKTCGAYLLGWAGGC